MYGMAREFLLDAPRTFLIEMGVSRPTEHAATVGTIGLVGWKGSSFKNTLMASKSRKAAGSRVPVALLSIPLRGTQVGAVVGVLEWRLLVFDAATIPPLCREGKAARRQHNTSNSRDSGRGGRAPWVFIATTSSTQQCEV